MTKNTIILHLPEEYLKIHVHSLCQIAAKYGVADKVYINKKQPGEVILDVEPATRAAILKEHFYAASALLAKHLENHLNIIEQQGHFEKPVLYNLKLPARKTCSLMHSFKIIKIAAL
jgi:hypothetical protein